MANNKNQNVLNKIQTLIEAEIPDLEKRKEFIEDDLTDQLDSWTSDIEDKMSEAEEEDEPEADE